MIDAIQVVTTTSDQADAERIASALVGRKLAACVQVNGPVESTYRWQGQVETSQEWVCRIKTLAERFPQVQSAIRELHSYDEPEIIATPIVAVSEGYLSWIAESVTETDQQTQP